MKDKNTWVEKMEVHSYDTDFQLQWKPAAFFRAMEVGAVHHAFQLGLDYFTLQEHKLAWVLSRVKIQFLRFPQVGDPIVLTTWTKGVQQKIFFMRDFLIEDVVGDPLAKVTTAWLIIDTDKRRFIRPQSLPIAYPEPDGRHALNEPLDKIKHQHDLRELRRFKAGYSDVDLMGHVNNTHYIDWISDCFSFEQIRGSQMDWLQINYNNEVKPEETVKLSLANNGSRSYTVEGHNIDSDTIAFEAMFGLKSNED